MNAKYTFLEDVDHGVWYYIPSDMVDLFWLAYDRMVDSGECVLWDKHKFASMRCLHPGNYAVENLEQLHD